jgi:hypothetical protein
VNVSRFCFNFRAVFTSTIACTIAFARRAPSYAGECPARSAIASDERFSRAATSSSRCTNGRTSPSAEVVGASGDSTISVDIRGYRALRGLTDDILSPEVLSGFASLNNMLHDMSVQTAAISSFAQRPEFSTRLLAPAEQYSRFL